MAWFRHTGLLGSLILTAVLVVAACSSSPPPATPPAAPVADANAETPTRRR